MTADEARCNGCGAGCDFADLSSEVGACYGSVTAIDQRPDIDATGETRWIHACVGHARIWFGGLYQPVGTGAVAAKKT